MLTPFGHHVFPKSVVLWGGNAGIPDSPTGTGVNWRHGIEFAFVSVIRTTTTAITTAAGTPTKAARRQLLVVPARPAFFEARSFFRCRRRSSGVRGAVDFVCSSSEAEETRRFATGS